MSLSRTPARFLDGCVLKGLTLSCSPGTQPHLLLVLVASPTLKNCFQSSRVQTLPGEVNVVSLEQILPLRTLYFLPVWPGGQENTRSKGRAVHMTFCQADRCDRYTVPSARGHMCHLDPSHLCSWPQVSSVKEHAPFETVSWPGSAHSV